MKTINLLLKTLLTIFCSICLIFSFIMIFIEGRLIISLDWIAYDNAVNGLIRYLFRFLISLFSFITVLLEIINLFKKQNNLFYYLLFSEISLVIISIIILILTTNYIGIVCIILSSLILLLKLGLLYCLKKMS